MEHLSVTTIDRRGRLATVVARGRFGGAVLVLAAVAWRQTSYWRDAETLWTYTVSCTSQNAMAHYGLGCAYAQQERVEEAISEVREAVAADSIDPLLIAECHDLLADQLTKQGKTAEALVHYEQAVRVCPKGALFHARLALALLAQVGTIEPLLSGARSFGSTLPFGRHVSASPILCWLAETLPRRLPSAARS